MQGLKITSNVKLKCFTLIEVLIAMVIVSVALLGIYTSMTMARRFVVDSRYHLEAERIAYDRARAMTQMKFEDLRSFADDQPVPGLLVETLTPRLYTNSELFAGAKNYSADLSLISGEIWTQVYNFQNSCKIVVSVRSLRHTFDGINWTWESITQYRYDHDQQ